MEKRIVYTPSFENYLIDLITILFFEEYFSYIENAEKYVIALRDEIEKYIDVRQHYKTPKFLSQYGSYFIVVSLNNKTSWYVFFDQRDQRYLVQYITNNHMEEASSLTLS